MYASLSHFHVLTLKWLPIACEIKFKLLLLAFQTWHVCLLSTFLSSSPCIHFLLFLLQQLLISFCSLNNTQTRSSEPLNLCFLLLKTLFPAFHFHKSSFVIQCKDHLDIGVFLNLLPAILFYFPCSTCHSLKLILFIWLFASSLSPFFIFAGIFLVSRQTVLDT